MATPAASFSTAQRIIQFAMRDAGILGEGEEPNSDQLAENLLRLNDLLNMMLTQGLKLFLWQEVSIPLVQGQSFYLLGPGQQVNMTKPLRAFQAYYLDTSGNRRPLVPMAWEEYMRLSNIQQQGSINSYFVDKQTAYLRVFLWLAPDAPTAQGSVSLLMETQASNPVSLTDTTSFPPEWFMALRWGLADDICTGMPAAIMQRCTQKALYYRQMLEDWDVEDAATRFAFDSTMAAYRSGSFR